MRNLIFILLVFLFSTSLFAYNWEDKGFTVLNKEEMDNEISLTVQTKTGDKIFIKYTDDISGKNVETILKLNSKFRKWTNMKVASINFAIVNGNVNVEVSPSYFRYKNLNILSYMPAGMIFYFDGHLKYNFRIISQKIFMRIDGSFLNEEKLCIKITDAIKDPMAYLSKYNPKYILSQIFKHDDALAKIDKKIDLNQKSSNRKFNELQVMNGNLLKKYNDLLERHKKLLNAVTTLHNTGFMGFGVNEISKKVVDRVIALKKEDPKLTKDKISEILEKEKIEAKSYEIFLILSVYFNEFKK